MEQKRLNEINWSLEDLAQLNERITKNIKKYAETGDATYLKAIQIFANNYKNICEELTK